MQRDTPLAPGEPDPDQRRGTVSLPRSGPGCGLPDRRSPARAARFKCADVRGPPPEPAARWSRNIMPPGQGSEGRHQVPADSRGDAAPAISSDDFPEFLLPAGTRPSHPALPIRASGPCPCNLLGGLASRIMERLHSAHRSYCAEFRTSLPAPACFRTVTDAGRGR